MVISVVSFPMVFFIPESPKFLYEKGRYSELRKVIKRIASFNKSKMSQNYVLDHAVERASHIEQNVRKSVGAVGTNHEEVEAETILKETKFSIWEELKKPIISFNLAICSVLFIACTYNYYMINFYLKYVGGNIFVNVILSTISENIAYNVGSCMESKLGLKKSFVLSFAISIVFGFPLIFWENNEYVVMA